jgi:Hint domain
MATFSWKAGTSADWNTTGDWTGAGTPPPGKTTTNTDVATFPDTTTGGGSYTVTVNSGETFDVATINVNNTGHTNPGLSITGDLLTGTLNYAATSGGSTTITVNAGGVFDIRNSITETGTQAETITIKADNGGAVGTGGHLELGSVLVDNSHVTDTFTNKGTTSLNTGEIEFQSGFVSGSTTTQQHISNLAWGDRLVFDGANFTGDTVSLNTTSHILTVSNGATNVLTMDNVSLQTGAANSFQVFGDTIGVVCYAAGSHILTSTGERIVESLMRGDIVLTLSGGELNAQPVKWLGRRRIDLTAHPHPETVAPVRIRRGAFADNMPHTDLLVSPDHAIFVDGKLICARQLINGTTIQQEKGWTSVEYFHVELDSHAILLAEGLLAESYLNTGNHGFFANSDEPLVLHPDLTDETDYPTREAGSCVPFVWDEASVRPVWQRLSERAAALGQPVRPAETTTDPALHLVAAGRRIKPVYADAGLFIFPLPRNARTVRLVSRASAPTDARPWLDDRRRLGVRLARIVLRDATMVREIPVDHPDLQQGWWAVERDGPATGRWTDGDAVLPLPAMHGVTMLEIHLRGALDYVVSEEDRQAA